MQYEVFVRMVVQANSQEVADKEVLDWLNRLAGRYDSFPTNADIIELHKEDHCETVKSCHRKLLEILGAIETGKIKTSSGFQGSVYDTVKQLQALINERGCFY